MAGPVQPMYPVAPFPWVLGVLRRLEGATVIDQLSPTTPLDLAVPCRWRWDAPGEYAVTGRAHLQVGQQLTAEVLTDAVGNLRRR